MIDGIGIFLFFVSCSACWLHRKDQGCHLTHCEHPMVWFAVAETQGAVRCCNAFFREVDQYAQPPAALAVCRVVLCYLVQIFTFYSHIINSSVSETLKPDCLMTLSMSPPLSRNPSFLIYRKIKMETASKYRCLYQISTLRKGVLGVLGVVIFHTLRSRNSMSVLCAWYVQQLCGLCFDGSVEHVPLKALKKIISAVKLSPGWGPGSCHPYQWLLHIHPTVHSSGGAMASGRRAVVCHFSD